MYTEVIQDAVIDLIDSGKVKFASGCSFTISEPVQKRLYGDLKRYRNHLVLRPQEISNNPEIVRRLGIITMNTALEADISGNINSTHVLGRSMMNGIGGSGDYPQRVPLHLRVSFRGQGGEDLHHRAAVLPPGPLGAFGLGPGHRVGRGGLARQEPAPARGIHRQLRASGLPRPARDYLKLAGDAHTPQTLSKAFRMHVQFQETGTMKGVSWA